MPQVRESVVRVENEKYYSLELKGPILPHVLPSLCHLMESSQLEQYSASSAQLASTISFSAAKHGAGTRVHVELAALFDLRMI